METTVGISPRCPGRRSLPEAGSRDLVGLSRTRYPVLRVPTWRPHPARSTAATWCAPARLVRRRCSLLGFWQGRREGDHRRVATAVGGLRRTTGTGFQLGTFRCHHLRRPAAWRRDATMGDDARRACLLSSQRRPLPPSPRRTRPTVASGARRIRSRRRPARHRGGATFSTSGRSGQRLLHQRP